MQSPEWQAEWIPTGPVTPVYLPRVPPPCSPSESDLEAQLELVGDDSFGRNLSREATISQLHSIGTIQTGSACSMRAWATPPPPDILWRRGGGRVGMVLRLTSHQSAWIRRERAGHLISHHRRSDPATRAARHPAPAESTGEPSTVAA